MLELKIKSVNLNLLCLVISRQVLVLQSKWKLRLSVTVLKGQPVFHLNLKNALFLLSNQHNIWQNVTAMLLFIFSTNFDIRYSKLSILNIYYQYWVTEFQTLFINSTFQLVIKIFQCFASKVF